MTPFVSVIIPHRNDSEKLSLCINALNKQTYPSDLYEIIVVDNCSATIHIEKLKEINKDYKITLLTEPKLSSYTARNHGLKHAKGSYIAFTDADCIPELDWIEKGIQEFNNGKCEIVGGKIVLFYKINNNPHTVELYEKIHSFKQEIFINNYNYAATANLFTLTKIINDVGYFNENMKSNGDIEWCLRAKDKGYNITYSNNIIVNHPARHRFKDFIKRQIRLCGGGFKLRKENGMSSFKLFMLNIFYIIPPVITIYRVLKNEDFKKTNSSIKKIKLIFLMIFVRYLKVLETFRLLLGFNPKNY